MVRPLTATDAREYFAFRLGGLEQSPLAFGRSAEEYRLEPAESVAAALHERPGEAVTLGAFVGGCLAGAVTVVRNPALKGRHKANVYAVYVAPSARGQRLGDLLLAALIDWARIAGIGQLHLTVSVTQNAARTLYLRHGFVVYGLEPRAMRIGGQDVDEELMVKFLDE